MQRFIFMILISISILSTSACSSRFNTASNELPPKTNEDYSQQFQGMHSGQTVTTNDKNQSVTILLGNSYISALGEACFEATVVNQDNTQRAFCKKNNVKNSDATWVLTPEISIIVQ